MRIKTTFVMLVVVALMAQALAGAASGTSTQGEATTRTQQALGYVQENHARFGVGSADVADLLVTDAYTSEHNGVTHVYLRQRVKGLEVAGANVTVNLLPNGKVFHVGSRLLSGIHEAATGTASIDAGAAVRSAASELGLTPIGLRIVHTENDAARTTRLSRAGISTLPIPAKLIFQPVSSGELRLAWNLEIADVSGDHWWNVSVDAATGEVLETVDLVDHDTVSGIAAAIGRKSSKRSAALSKIYPKKRAKDGSKYRVYPVPLESPNDGKRAIRRNPADRKASPFGWHDDNGKRGYEHTTTQGNNVHAYLDPSGPANAPAFEPTYAEGGEGLDFDFPVDYSLPPVTYKDAAVTNLFYWNNVIHDVFYRYGFTERAGNFQTDNYKRGGKGSDAVRAQAQDTGGANNANFATPEDGIPPRMQMYIWPGVDQVIDGDMDSGVITHEYAHGISNRLTGGPSETGCLSSHDEREGEGWSDFLAIALTARKGEKGRDPRGMGTYVLGQESRKERGIRPTPYSTYTGINPSTYNTIRGAAEPHGVGYVWATMLWEVYWKLVNKHGFNPNPYEGWRTGGNNLAIQLVMDGMKMQPCEPGFVDARDAVIAADKALTGGKNRCAIWAAFAKRGLGYKAEQNDPASKVDGVENYATHPKCR